MKSNFSIYLTHLLLFFVLISYSCRSKGEKSQQNSQATEPIDSAYVEQFLLKNPEFKAQRKKIIKFYSRRNFDLAWFQKEQLLPQAAMFINMINNIANEGVAESRYDFKKLKSSYSTVVLDKKTSENTEQKKNLDLLLTASYFNYAKYIWRGIVDPKDEEIEWYVQRKKIKYGKTLDAILEDKAHPFSKFEPLNPQYGELKKQLTLFRALEKKGGWPTIPLTEGLKKGDTSSAVISVRNTLVLLGDLKYNNQKKQLDNELTNALIKFQRRHGLKEDGELSKSTLQQLNVPVTDRIKQIILNMERWRWVPDRFNENYLIVNIPEYKLRIYEKNKEVLGMNVIVGKAANSTPIFNDELETVVFSPYWNVPKSIVVNELLPLLRKNPVVVEKENMEVYEGKPDNIIDPYQVDWNTVDENNLKYQFRQKPGPGNALGKVKFLFPNDYDVYLHDTPGHELFSQTQRGFSHGCIRLEKPKELAEYLLKNMKEWDEKHIEEAMNKGEEQFVKLDQKLPIFILYFTSWVDEKGNINFRDDIYSHDEKLAKSFFEAE